MVQNESLQEKWNDCFELKKKQPSCFSRGRFSVGPMGNGRSLMSATPGV